LFALFILNNLELPLYDGFTEYVHTLVSFSR